MSVSSAKGRGKRVGRDLLAALLAALVGAFLGGFVPFLGLLGSLLGVGAANFGWGLLGGPRFRYALAAVGGAVAGGVVTFTDYAVLALAGGGVVVLVGALGGATAAALGRYFGADLRHGFTREL